MKMIQNRHIVDANHVALEKLKPKLLQCPTSCQIKTDEKSNVIGLFNDKALFGLICKCDMCNASWWVCLGCKGQNQHCGSIKSAKSHVNNCHPKESSEPKCSERTHSGQCQQAQSRSPLSDIPPEDDTDHLKDCTGILMDDDDDEMVVSTDDWCSKIVPDPNHLGFNGDNNQRHFKEEFLT